MFVYINMYTYINNWLLRSALITLPLFVFSILKRFKGNHLQNGRWHAIECPLLPLNVL